jgi:hypothetical protein
MCDRSGNGKTKSIAETWLVQSEDWDTLDLFLKQAAVLGILA